VSSHTGKDAPRETTLEMPLEAARWRHLAWAVVGLGLATLMVVRMGELGLVLGAIVGLLGLKAGRAFVLTLLHPPGTIAVRDDAIVLPDQLSSGHSVTVPLAELRHAYLLRRAIPWSHTGPVLVVETRRGVFQYPRDWFSAEVDQRRVSQTLNRRLGRVE
jgi:hypothetical protein